MNATAIPKVKPSKITNVEILRFFAASCVVVEHLNEIGEKKGFLVHAPAALQLINWNIGVDIFFVISGFVMSLSIDTVRQGLPETRKFLVRRLERICPAYWFFTSLMVAAALAFPALVSDASPTAGSIIASYLFIPWPNGAGSMHPLLGVGWTLNYEMEFYCLAGACLLLAPAIRHGALMVLIGIVAACGLLAPSAPILRFWTSPIILEFAYGIAVYIVHRHAVRTRALAGKPLLPLVLVAVALIWMIALRSTMDENSADRFLAMGVPALLLVAGVTLAGTYSGAGAITLASLGEASYALYLCHPFLINIVLHASRKFLGENEILYYVAGAATAIFASYLFYRYLERPVLLAFRRLREERALPVSQAF